MRSPPKGRSLRDSARAPKSGCGLCSFISQKKVLQISAGISIWRMQETEEMNREGKCYGLLTGVGIYQDAERKTLPAAKKDLLIMRQALTEGLKFDPDNIRVLGEDGRVEARSFARALSEFEPLLTREDTFVLYYSGHGAHSALCFTDEYVNLQSIVSYIERLSAGKKIVILDCCFSGAALVSDIRELTFEEAIASFAGSGIAVMASSAQNERSWLSEIGDASLYTRIVAAAVRSRRHLHEGRLSLSDINDEVRNLMQMWNRTRPERQQHPIFRENYIGEISFRVEEYHPYVTQKITAETEDYLLHSVKPLSTGTLKRFAAFIILKKADDTMLPRITWEIVSQFKTSDVYENARSEQQFRGRSADAIWCYFGHDVEDIERSNHFAYTIWAGREELQKQYYRENRNSEVVDGIYIFWNTSYGLVKDLQKTDTPQEQVIAEYEKLAARLMGRAEEFIRDFEEAENHTISLEEMKNRCGSWIRDVKQAYFRLTDADPVPAERTRWAEAILELAGWVTDMALFLEQGEDQDAPEEIWMVKHAIRRYRQSLEKLRKTVNSVRESPA